MKTAYFPLTGRLGNLMFQYAYARTWCEQNGYELCTDPWIGEKIFTIPEANRNSNLADIVFPENYRQRQEDLIYTRKQVREWFTFKPEILERLNIRHEREDKVILNLRQGMDYTTSDLVTISAKSYWDAFRKHGLDSQYGPHEVGVESDLYPTQARDFPGDVWASGGSTTMVALPSFYRLMTAKVLFRANSTFSWWAATLGNGRVFSPVITGLETGKRFVACDDFVEGNWPQMTKEPVNTDLHLKDE